MSNIITPYFDKIAQLARADSVTPGSTININFDASLYQGWMLDAYLTGDGINGVYNPMFIRLNGSSAAQYYYEYEQNVNGALAQVPLTTVQNQFLFPNMPGNSGGTAYAHLMMRVPSASNPALGMVEMELNSMQNTLSISKVVERGVFAGGVSITQINLIATVIGFAAQCKYTVWGIGK